ncbi:MAG: undecaprenyl-diphosphate phosphatase [Desulfobacterales bacterium]|jgi:undecaprenyl-diphosphatase|nr:undecaprenyl-diphosphate phosphatase [Desulfobacterales bacterium]
MDILLFIKAVILGIVEGATEFIPVSSTGHLIIVQNWLDFTGKKEFAFSIFIQLGAILAVVWLYRQKLFDVVCNWPTDTKARQLIINLILGTLPAVVIGLPTEDWIETHFFKPIPVALALVFGGIAILIIERLYTQPKINDVDEISWKTALMIGMIQVLSILFPGVSRSGATIMGGLALGLSRTAAAEFSFFLAIPAMCGASILKLKGAAEIITSADIPFFAIGFIVSFVSALLVIKGFLAFISRKSFNAFAWYRIIFGLSLLIMYWGSSIHF